MSRAATCPGPDELESFLLGQTSEPQAALLESHLAQCAACLRTAQTLTAQDPLTETVRVALAALDEADSAVLPALIERLRELSHPGEPPASEEKRGAPAPAGGPGDEWQVTAAAGTPLPEEATAAPTAWAAPPFEFLAPPAGPGEIGRLGPYRILQILGRGGMGVVFQAEDPSLGRLVALKAMLPGQAAKSAARERFLREGRAAAAIEHDHIVSIYQVCEGGASPFLVMPLLRGESLEDRLRREDRLAVPEALRIAREIAEGLAAAHQGGLIHRDVKPGNVWLEGDRARVKILDFGLARPTEDTAHLTHPGLIVGTPAYMAPEQARGGEVDPRSDLFSLGCVLYRMCTGRVPFQGTDPLATLTSLALDEPPSATALNPAVPPAVSDLIAWLLAKDPAARPQTARAVVEAIATVESGKSKGKQGSGRLHWRLARAAALLAVLALLAYFCVPALLRLALKQDQAVVEPRREPRAARVFTAHARAVSGVVFTPDGRRAYSCSPDDTVRLWDLEAGREAGAPWEVQRSPFRIVFAPDGRHIAFGYGRTWYLWQLEPRNKLCELQVKGDQLRCAAFSLSGRRLIGAAAHGGGSCVQVWDTTTGKELRVFNDCGPRVACVALSPHGSLALWTGRDGVHTRDVATGQERWRMERGSVSNAAFAPDGNSVLLGGAEGLMVLHSAAAGKELRRFQGHKGDVGAVAFSPDGRRCLSGSADASVRLWNTATGEELACLWGHTGGIGAVAFSPDGARAISGGDDHTVRLWELPHAPTAAIRKVRTLEGHANIVLGMAFGPDGAWLASASRDRAVVLWDTDSGRPLHFLKGHKAQVWGVACSADGLLASASDDGTVRLWDPADGKSLATLGGRGGPFLQVAFSPDGRWLGGARADGRVVLWDVALRQEVRTFAGHSGRVHGLAFSPDGQRLASGADDRTVKLWDVAGGGLVHTLTGHTQLVHALAFSPDGKRLASASFDGDVKLWDTVTGAEVFTLRGHNGPVEAVAFGPQRQLVSGSSDRSVRLWDAATGKALQTLEQDENIYALAFSPDGRLLALGGADRVVGLWSVPARLAQELRGKEH